MAIFEMFGLKNPGVTAVNKIYAAAKAREKTKTKPTMSKPTQGGGYKKGGAVTKAGKSLATMRGAARSKGGKK